MEHYSILTAIQSDLLDVCVSTVETLNSHQEYVNLLQNCLYKYFDIDKSYFLFKEGELLKLLCGESFLELEYSRIPAVIVEPYFHQEKLIPLPYFLSSKEEFKE